MTKIVATIGPASDTEEIIEHLIEAGVNVFRFNTKHGTTQWHEERIKRVQQIANKLGKDIGILMDLQGPEIRLETFDKKPIFVERGETLKITVEPTEKFKSICIPRKEVFEALNKGDQILIDDGSIELKVTSVSESLIEAVTEDPGEIGHRKGVNFPGVRVDLPSLIKDDLEKLSMAGVNKVDFVALSFCRTKMDVENLRKELEKRKMKSMVVAKIESREALDNIDEIIEAADGIMVARGDLGVEVPIEELAYWQKKIIEKCRVRNKPVITATQMLQSMIENLRPTRAEATDVANAVLRNRCNNAFR
ncbi:MAG: Pyruvate kinase [Candidatus Nomurabacteria bacterium GW2011_GWF1_31_48]|uniref:Pyruvate kinase n=1 Tax=Candidatus Nomurabacteria bacterium GW2011_GWF1_31_48 TaxID=1618767 RepID=A0A0G0AR49_9BACT|nr:MAG: Pyruvate kinase [Candidatus Nomurabacteria bacterium GW2011_GWF1_31_48]